MWLVLNGNPYPGTVDGLNEPALFYLTWWISGFIMAPVVVFAAHYYTIYVDNRCVAFTKRLERWATS